MSTALNYLLVAAGGAVGAPLRYLTDRFVQARHDTAFPWGTFCVNIVGSLVLGTVAGIGLGSPSSSPMGLLIGVGFCGALTTWSTLSYETARLLEQRARFFALANLSLSIAVGLGAVTIGYAVGTG